MQSLSLEHINEKSSYQVEPTDKDGFYQFFTSPRDCKVRDTIVSIVDEFFNRNNSTLLYICETGDDKQRMRSRLFEYWFSTYNRKALFTMMSSSIVDADGIVNFATIILRNDNPHLSEVITEFTESIQLLSQKPQ